MSRRFNTGLDNKRIAINMVFSVIAFALNTFISFFITPYITKKLGSDAYGFVKLANDFTSYASLASIALNSMASRFIMLEREKKNFDGAIRYYSSITIANIVLSAILALPSLICIIFLDKIINVPVSMITEVRITFAITFTNFMLSLAFSTFGNCYYLTNRLDKSSVRNMQSNIIRVGCILGLFLAFSPHISFIAVGSLASVVFLIICNLYYHRKLTPDLVFDRRTFDWAAVREVLAAGVWNSLTKLSQIFSSGLDLLVTNIFIGSTEMGYLSIAKTIPSLIVSLNSTVSNAFNPNMMQLYAKGDMQQLKKATKSAMRFMCLFVTVPTAILITMGEEFFCLWVPDQPAKLINILSVLTVVNSCITGPMQPLYQVFTIANKVKQSSIVMIIYGFASILCTYICLQTTNLGLYAVAGVSLVGSVVVALCYHIPFAAVYVGLPWYTFFPEILKSVLSLAVVSAVGALVNLFFALETSWIMWFTGAGVTACIGLCLNALLILNKKERKKLLSVLYGKLRRR
ncbi:MAG: lipopolysaccharide biosynthesis protein [Acutalibacteraceae bacterium]